MCFFDAFLGLAALAAKAVARRGGVAVEVGHDEVRVTAL
jgi:hypothetical protein